MSPDHLGVLCHSLGLDDRGRGRAYRSHFVTGPGSKDWKACNALVDAGLMTKHEPRELTGGDFLFVVTDAGREAVRAHFAALPNVKESRSKARYLSFLAEDSGLRFGEWLRVDALRRKRA